MRHVCYVSGTRADFGLMRSTLEAIAAAPDLRLSVLATGMHLSPLYGETVREIEEAGLAILARVPVPLDPPTGATMGRNIGTMVAAFTDALEQARPDLALLLGDRGEMLAGALAAIHLNIPVAHIHGGERSGTVDEPIRHAISKLSHLHFTATDEARERLIRMGEREDRIFVTGAPGLDSLTDAPLPDRAAFMADHGLDAGQPFALFVFHPVLQEADRARADTEAVLDALCGAGLQILALMPNSDAGSAGVREALQQAEGRKGIVVLTHMPRPEFVAAMAHADLMAGNSSAGIIEAASFGTPVLNVGRRQTLRGRNANVCDVPADAGAMREAVDALLSGGRFPAANVYGDGKAGERIVRLLVQLPLDADLLHKVNGY